MGFLLNIFFIFIVVNIVEIFVIISSSAERISKSVNISQGYFTNNIPVHDFVYPVKVSRNGKQSSNLLTIYYSDDYAQRRKKREIKKEEKLRYNLPLNNGKTLELVLTPNYDIATPSLVVEHKNIETEFNIGKSRLRRASKRKCYYRGKVLNEPNSDVALSTCRGLAGFIRSSDGEYFIEPASDYDPTNGVHTHVVFKKAYRDSSQEDGGISGCWTKVNDNKEEEIFGRIHKDSKEPVEIVFNKRNVRNDKRSNSENESQEQDNDYDDYDDDNVNDNDAKKEVKLLTKSTVLFKKEIKLKKKAKSEQKLDDNSDEYYSDSEHFSDGVTTEQYSVVNGDSNKNHSDYDNDDDDDDKLEKKNLSKNKKLNTNANNRSENIEINENDSKDGDNDEYDYSHDADNFNKSSKKLDQSDENLTGCNSPSHCGRLPTHVHDKLNGSTAKDDNDEFCSGGVCKKKQADKSKSSKCKSVIKEQNDERGTACEINTDSVAKLLSDDVDKIKKDIFNTVRFADDKKLFLTKNEIKSKIVNRDLLHKHNPNWTKPTYFRKTERQDDFVGEDIHNYDYGFLDDIDYNEQLRDGLLSMKNDADDRYLDGYSRMYNKREIEYKSCKLPPSCKNKTECSWDLRLLMVISHLFSQRHKDIDLETFVLTVVNMINRNFQDSSLGVLINIKLVRMVFIEYKMDELDEDKNKIEDLFENFCLFQYRINPFKSDHPNHHDMAVYIISTDVCVANTLYGLSHQSSICDCQKSCIIAVDDGLLLGNIITHQLGHSLGAEHDIKGTEQTCDAIGRKIYFHMDPSITLNGTQWSKCSSAAIRHFMKIQGSKCLKHMTVDLNFDWTPYMLPGQIYNPVQQCSLNFRMPLLPCYTGDFCKSLYCQISESHCISNLVAPADGTMCATRMWCVRGYCVTQGRYPNMVNGEWNAWGNWSPCSRTCGGGVQQADRQCNNPRPSRGGRFCIGQRRRYRMCNTERCDQHSMGFREQQCRKTDDVPFRGQIYSWTTYHNNFEYVECSLLCESETGIVAVRRLVVEDGTMCKPGTRNVCIAGKCVEIGCDWGIKSGARVDACGLCHGNGTECRIIQGLYSEKDNKGYIPFMKVPRGSGMIYARELNPSDLTFVVSSFNTGNFYLNTFGENARKPRTGEYNFGSARGLYSVLGGMERIFIPGPTDEDLIFFAKFNKGKNPGIRYQFAVPEVDPNYIPTYSWQFIDWETCSSACGGGQQKSCAKCVEDQGGVVEDMYCSELKKPSDALRSCNEFPCLPKWWVGSWSECLTIESEEVRYRSVLCMRTRDPNSLRNEILKEKFCCEEEKPDSVRRCNETYQRCEEKAQKCGLKIDFPSVLNLNDLNVRFADLDDKEKNDDYEGKNDYLQGNIKSGNNGGKSFAYQGNKTANMKQEIDGYFNKKALPSDVKEIHAKHSDSGKDKSLQKSSNKLSDVQQKISKTKETAKVVEDVISRESVKKLAAIKESPRKVPPAKLHQVESVLHNKQTRNDSVKSANVCPKNSKLVKTEITVAECNEPVETSVATTVTVPRQLAAQAHKPTEIPTTCQVMFTCNDGEKDICNISEQNVPYKCPPLSPPLKSVMDQYVLNEYKLAIIPTICEKHVYRPADHDYENFIDTTLWVVGLENKKTILYGKDALDFLLNLRRNMSHIPFIFQAEN